MSTFALYLGDKTLVRIFDDVNEACKEQAQLLLRGVMVGVKEDPKFVQEGIRTVVVNADWQEDNQ
jgi:hypothetical protein